LRNIGSVLVEGAQGEISAAHLAPGTGGFAGHSPRGGLPGSWHYVNGPFERDVEYEWESNGRPFEWSDAWYDPYDPGSVGARGDDGLEGEAGVSVEFGGLGTDTVANAMFVEALQPALVEGQAPGFLFTRSGDPFTPVAVAY